MKQLHQKPVNLKQPDDVQWQWIDSATGNLSAQGCAGAMYIPLQASHIPNHSTDCALPGYQVAPDASASDPVTSGQGDDIENLIHESNTENQAPTRVISSGSYEQN